jgi:quercetin 2,3-dioxygenase
VTVRKEHGIHVRVFSGQSGNVRGPAVNHVPVTMLDVRLIVNENTGTLSFAQEIPVGDEGFIYVIEGEGLFGSDKINVSTGQIAHLADTDITNGPTRLTVTAKENLRFLLWTGHPLHEPVVSRGPFVINTQEQIVEAFADYHAGNFGGIPKRDIE